jgi:hypothetical protein
MYRDISIQDNEAQAMLFRNTSLPTFAEAMSTLYDTLGGRPCLLSGRSTSNLSRPGFANPNVGTRAGVPMMLRPHPTGHAIHSENYHQVFDAQTLEIIMTQGTAYRSRILGALLTNNDEARKDWQAGVLLGITLDSSYPERVPISEEFSWTSAKPSRAQPHIEVSSTYTAQVCYLPLSTRNFAVYPIWDHGPFVVFVPGVYYTFFHTTTGNPVGDSDDSSNDSTDVPEDHRNDRSPSDVHPEDLLYNVAADEYNSIDFPGCMELTRIFKQLKPNDEENIDPWWDYPPHILGRFPNQQWGPQWSVRDHV